MKKYITYLLVTTLLVSCSPAYELYSRAGWVEIESAERVTQYGFPDHWRVHYVTDRRVPRYADMQLSDSSTYFVGRRFLIFEGR